jgi:uncharacterized protein involved in outer membrane biogenesis
VPHHEALQESPIRDKLGQSSGRFQSFIMVNISKIKGLLHSRRVKKYALGILSFIVLVGVVGFFIIPPIVKSIVLDQLGAALHRPVKIRSISVNPYNLSVSLDGVTVHERQGSETFAGFDTLYLNVESSSLFRGGLVVGEIRLVNPKLNIVRLADNRYNFSDLLDAFLAKPKPKTNEPAPLFSLNNIQISGGEVSFEDQPVHDKHRVTGIKLNLPFISNMAYAVGSFVEPAFAATINGAPLEIKGKSKPFSDSLESELSLDIDDLQLAKYLEYSPLDLPIGIKSGALDSKLRLVFRQEKGQPSTLTLSGTAALKSLNVVDSAGAPLVLFKQLELAIGSADLLKRKFIIDRLALDSPELYARVNRAGLINWNTLLPKAKATKGAALQKPADSPQSPPLEWSVGELKVAGGRLNWLDESRAEPLKATVDALDLVLKDVASKGTTPADFSARMTINGKGDVALNGKVLPAPLKVDLALDVKTLELLPLQPLFAERLNVTVTRGQLTASGNLQLRQAESQSSSTPGSMTGGFAGQATLGDFQAVDKLNTADFLRWKSLYFGGIDVRLNPDSVEVGEVALTDFFSRVIVDAKGRLNLLRVVRRDEAPADSVASAGKEQPGAPAESGSGKAVAQVSTPVADAQPVMPVKIGKITLQAGTVRFTDNFVKPNYSANLKQIGGRISGLSSAPGSTASLELRGTYDNIAPLTLTAKINPLSSKPYLDLQAEIKGVELTSFTSYAAKYAGYAIDKGKLSLFVNYKIDNDQLTAENRVFLDQLTFGERIESPEATKLPVTLAVSLLKNRNGEIDLNLPISGSLNDPQFSIGGLVVKVIVNLLVKAVTSPFALLGSMFGGGEEMSNVEFDFGRALISPESQKRLENLASALNDRPALKLEVLGRIDRDNDSEGLKRARIERKVRALKREDLARKGGEPSADEIEDTSRLDDYPALLERVYRAEKFPKPRNMVGMMKTLPVEEMEKLMITHALVDEDDLRDLGERRARVVRDWLVAHEVASERVFILPSKFVEKEATPVAEQKTTKGSRVDFSLK